jgi:hypothetical protein
MCRSMWKLPFDSTEPDLLNLILLNQVLLNQVYLNQVESWSRSSGNLGLPLDI